MTCNCAKFRWNMLRIWCGSFTFAKPDIVHWRRIDLYPSRMRSKNSHRKHHSVVASRQHWHSRQWSPVRQETTMQCHWIGCPDDSPDELWNRALGDLDAERSRLDLSKKGLFVEKCLRINTMIFHTICLSVPFTGSDFQRRRHLFINTMCRGQNYTCRPFYFVMTNRRYLWIQNWKTNRLEWIHAKSYLDQWWNPHIRRYSEFVRRMLFLLSKEPPSTEIHLNEISAIDLCIQMNWIDNTVLN